MIREDWQTPIAELCTCTTDPDGQTNTDGCVLDDFPLCGLLIGEDN